MSSTIRVMVGLAVAGAGGGEEDFWTSVAVANDLVEIAVLEQRMECVGRENARRTREQRAAMFNGGSKC